MILSAAAGRSSGKPVAPFPAFSAAAGQRRMTHGQRSPNCLLHSPPAARRPSASQATLERLSASPVVVSSFFSSAKSVAAWTVTVFESEYPTATRLPSGENRTPNGC